MNPVILYSGQARTFASCFPNQYWMVLRHFPNPLIFASVTDDYQASSMQLLMKKFPRVKIETVKQPDFPEAKDYAQTHAHGGYGISAEPENVMKAFWQLKRVWEFADLPPNTQHTVVRIRPDLWFQEFEMPYTPDPSMCFTPAWGSYGGINDRFAVMGQKAAEAYFTTFDRVGQLLSEGCPYHPESLTRAGVESGGAYVHQTLAAEFKIRRMADPKSYDMAKRQEWLVPEPFLPSELYRAVLHS